MKRRRAKGEKKKNKMVTKVNFATRIEYPARNCFIQGFAYVTLLVFFIAVRTWIHDFLMPAKRQINERQWNTVPVNPVFTSIKRNCITLLRHLFVLRQRSSPRRALDVLDFCPPFEFSPRSKPVLLDLFPDESWGQGCRRKFTILGCNWWWASNTFDESRSFIHPRPSFSSIPIVQKKRESSKEFLSISKLENLLEKFQ